MIDMLTLGAAPHFKSHPGDSSLFHDLLACIINSIVDDRVYVFPTFAFSA